MNTISYTITVYNETKELSELLSVLSQVATTSDEVIVVHTFKNEDEKLTDTFNIIQSIVSKYTTLYFNFHFQNKFADMKNFVNSLATKDYIINFDADETIDIDTIPLWKKMLNDSNDLYYVPRINTIDNYTISDIKKYQWRINSSGWINWPDYQPRIYKNNKSMYWSGNVHEQLNGFRNAIALPPDPKLAIIHSKTMTRQKQQNALYETIKR